MSVTLPKGARVGSRSPRVNHNARFEDLLAFQMRAMGLPTPERQYPFAKSFGRKFAADFAFVPFRLLVEVNGGIWKKGGGAHSHPLNIERDIEKQQYAVRCRFHLLPVTTDQVSDGTAVRIVREALGVSGWDERLHGGIWAIGRAT